MNIHEIWKPIAGYEELYEVSNMGRVKSLKSKVILKPSLTKKGYLRVELYKDGKSKKFLVHCLVYRTFNGEIPAGLQVNHINEVKSDNRLTNLNIMTNQENCEYSKAISIIACDKQGNFVHEFKSLAEAAEWLDNPKAHTTNICKNLKGRIPSAYGYIWKYKD